MKKYGLVMAVLAAALGVYLAANYVLVSEGERAYKKATQYVIERDPENAILYLEKAIELGYENGTVYSTLGAMYGAQGDRLAAREQMFRGLRLYEDELAEYRRKGQAREALKTMDIIEKTKTHLAKL